MADIRALPTRAKRCNEEAVETLRSFLARAEAGDIDSVAIAATTLKGETVTAWTASEDWHRLHSALSVLSFRFVSERSEA